MSLGDHATWGFSAPAGETITGLGTVGGGYHSSDGWISGWAANGLVASDPLPANEDCTSQNQLDSCTRTSGGWVSVPNASSLQLIIRCDASSTSSVTHCRNGLSYVSADVDTAVMQLRDPSNPTFSTSGSLWQAATGIGLAHGWVSGLDAGAGLSLSFSASNPAGICRLEAALTNPQGTVVASSVPRSETPKTDAATGSKLSTTAPFGSSLPCGGAATAPAQFAPDLSGLPTGVYYLNVSAQDPAEYQSGAETYAVGASLAGGYPIAIDNSVPTVSIATGTSADQWYPGTQTATVTAGDAVGSSGLETLSCDLNGTARTYGLSGDRATVSIPLSDDGSNELACSATSAAGNVSSIASATVRIDRQLPTIAFSGASAAPTWATTPKTVTVSASEPVALAGIASTSCSLDGAVARTATGATQSVTVSGDGVHRLVCTATTTSGVTGKPVPYVVQVDAQAPTISFAGAVPAPAWTSGDQVVVAHAAEPTQLAGITATTCQLDGGTWVTKAGDTETVAISTGGRHTVTCHALTGAGVTGPNVAETLQVDDQLPQLTLSDGPAQDAWYRSSQTIAATATARGGDDLAAIDCTLDGVTKRYGAASGATTEDVRITVPPAGGDLVCQAVDTAGNRSTDVSWVFQIDASAPSGVFEPHNGTDPAALAVRASDSGSGVASVQVQIDESSGWVDLPTHYDRRGGIATADVPDDGSLRNGTYAVRAVIFDRAGNETTVTGDQRGAAEVVTLPLRQLTELSAVVSAGSRHVVTASAGHRSRVLRLRHGQGFRVAGSLDAHGGAPVAGGTVTISELVAGRSRVQRLGQTRTDAAGRFAFEVRGGPSRTLIVSFPGSQLLRMSSATSAVQVRGLVRLFVPRVVRAGRRTTIRGRVFGGYLPTGGVLVQLWYTIRHSGLGWEPFERAIRTGRSGRFRLTFPVSRRARNLTYSFRAVAAGQAGWPYLSTVSNPVSRRFR